MHQKNVAGLPVESNQIEYHYVNYEGMLVYSWIKWNTQLESLGTLADDIARLFHISQSEPCGTTYFTLHQDLMANRLENNNNKNEFARNILKKWQRVTSPIIPPRLPDISTTGKIYNELLSHSFPEIIVSHLGKKKSNLTSLVNFSHMFGLPVHDYRSFMNFPITDMLHVGFTKMTKPPKLLDGADLAIALDIGLLPHQRFGDI